VTVSDNHDEYAAAAVNNGGSMKVKPYLKGLYAAAVAFAGGVTAAQPDVSGTEWTTIGVVTVLAAVGVFYVPYAPTVKPPAA
jgi:hypothetical protein